MGVIINDMWLRISLFVFVALFASLARAADDFCFSCHSDQEGTSLKFKSDNHYQNSLSCADCHGGDPTINDMNTSKTPQKGFRLRVQRQDTPMFCAGCHTNAKFMATYKANAVTNQFALYSRSVHGKKLAAGKTEAAQCVDCHGIHDIRPARDPDSPTHPSHVGETCAKCHAETAATFKDTPHDRRGRATCTTCHGSHDIKEATTAMLTGDSAVCADCHRENSRQRQVAARIAEVLKKLEAANPDAREALTAARRAVHTVNPDAVQRAFDAAVTRSATRPAGP